MTIAIIVAAAIFIIGWIITAAASTPPGAYLGMFIAAPSFIVLILLLVIVFATRAHAADHPKLPQGVTCSDVRERVAEHGRAAAIAWALASGYSWRQIREARKICGV